MTHLHGNASLTEEQVIEIRKHETRRRVGLSHMTYKGLGKRYGVSAVAILNAAKGRTFRYLPLAFPPKPIIAQGAPTAAPNRWPYLDHRTVAEVIRDAA